MVEFWFSDDATEVFPIRIETERLVLRHIGEGSVSVYDLFEIHSSDEYDELLTGSMPGDADVTPKETAERVERQIDSFSNNESASYVISECGCEDDIIGRAGFGVDWDICEMQCFIWLLEEYHNDGYSTERGEAFLELAFERLCLETVRVGCVIENEASKSAIEKYVVGNGGKREGVFRQYKEIDGELRDIVYYSIVRDEWFGE